MNAERTQRVRSRMGREEGVVRIYRCARSHAARPLQTRGAALDHSEVGLHRPGHTPNAMEHALCMTGIRFVGRSLPREESPQRPMVTPEQCGKGSATHHIFRLDIIC